MEKKHLKKTPLHAEHLKAGAKMVPFAGWEMPVQYEGVIAEHKQVREACGLFDVSHMGEFLVSGPRALDFLQSITCNDLESTVPGQVQYNALIAPDGGVVDDVTIYNRGEAGWLVVVNAANIDKDLNFMKSAAEEFSETRVVDESSRFALLALQGPGAPRALESCLVAAAREGREKIFPEQAVANLLELGYYRFREYGNGDGTILVSRTGYTGEDGYEIYLPVSQSVELWKQLLSVPEVRPAGLGARDTLRLEARYPLYGHELNQERTIVEGGQGWIVKDKRPAPACQGRLLEQKKDPTKRRGLVRGFEMVEPGIAREETEIVDPEGRVLGVVTSGTHSPSLERGLGMAFLYTGFNEESADLFARIRGRDKRIKLVKGAFWRGTAGQPVYP